MRRSSFTVTEQLERPSPSPVEGQVTTTRADDPLLNATAVSCSLSQVLQDNYRRDYTLQEEQDEYVKVTDEIEYLSAIIGWHERGLVPLGASLTDDNRCKFVNADFFSLASNPQQGLDLEYPGRRFDAILVDIDHTPDYLLDEASSNFYSENGLATLVRHLEPNGVFGLWSAGEPDDSFVNRLETCFESAEASVVEFTNPLLSLDDRNTIYIGISPS